MSRLINADLTGLATFPYQLDEVVAGADMPIDGLTAFWRDTLITLNGSNVASWKGYGPSGGEVAEQGDAAKQPAYASGSITGDGTDDVLETGATPGSEGYMVVRFIPGTLSGGTRSLVGSQVSGTERLWLGMNGAGTLGCAIGSLSVTALQATGAPVSGTAETLGIHYEGGNATLRRNGVVADTGTYTGSIPSIAIYLGARNQAGTPLGFHDWSLRAVAVYSKTGGYSSGELDAIDAALTAL